MLVDFLSRPGPHLSIRLYPSHLNRRIRSRSPNPHEHSANICAGRPQKQSAQHPSEREHLHHSTTGRCPEPTKRNFERSFGPMCRGLPETRQKRVLPDGSSLLTTTEGGATGLAVAVGKVEFPYFAAAGWPERNHTLGQLLPPKSRFLSLYPLSLSNHAVMVPRIMAGMLTIVTGADITSGDRRMRAIDRYR